MKKLCALAVLLSCSSIIIGMENNNQIIQNQIIQFRVDNDTQFMNQDGRFENINDEQKAAITGAYYSLNQNGNLAQANFYPLIALGQKEERNKQTFWNRYPQLMARIAGHLGFFSGAGIVALLCWNGSLQNRIEIITKLFERAVGELSVRQS